MKKEHRTLNELVKELSPYISACALGRICNINEGQIRQYISGVRNPSPKTIDRINDGINRFGEELKGVKIKNPGTK
jgi:hypothetical protein